MKLFLYCMSLIMMYSCKNSETNPKDINEPSNDISAISAKTFTEFKVLDSEFIDNAKIWEPFEKDLKGFTEEKYNTLKPLILEQDIPTLHQYIQEGKLSYENLTKFYLYRIRKFDRENDLSLNSVISLNSNVISEAKQKDSDNNKPTERHPIFGMPILLKDNINTLGMPTTAGALAFQNNNTAADAFIVERLKEQGGLILGKVNLSEWAYFFCGDCPSGYSAIGGQTLNPYGRKTMDTGGSSSGSGVAVAANFCVAAIGTETAGSILSPASQNSVVGLKPTVGLFSRAGIVPISSTLDTPGPITKNVIDNAIVLDAMLGYDVTDSKAISTKWGSGYYYAANFKENSLESQRFGAFKELMKDTLYVRAIADLKSKGAIIVEIEEENLKLPDFLRLLNLDMQKDFTSYVVNSGDANLTLKSVEDVIAFNSKDSIVRMPYGQMLFEGIVADSATDKAFITIKNTLKTNGKLFFDTPMEKHNLDGILSINNNHSDFAAVAEYPAITIPMGYTDNGEPEGLTFIGKPLSELPLLRWVYTYEQASKRRVAPKDYN